MKPTKNNSKTNHYQRWVVSGWSLRTSLALVVCFSLLAAGAAAQDEEFLVHYNKDGEPLLTVGARNVSVPALLSTQIVPQSKIPVRAEGKVVGMKISMAAVERPFLEVLKTLAAQLGCELYSPKGSGEYILVDHDTYKRKYLPLQTEKRVFQLYIVPPEEVEQLIEGFLTPEIGSVVVDLRTGQLIVSDRSYVLTAIENLIGYLEVKPVAHVFRIKHGNLAFIAETLKNESKRTFREELKLVVDEQNRRIIVIGTPKQVQQVETWVEMLNPRPELRRYPLDKVVEGAVGFEELELILDQLLTPEAFCSLDKDNQLLIVHDLPKVHEDLERALAAIGKRSNQLEGESLPPAKLAEQSELVFELRNYEFEVGEKAKTAKDTTAKLVRDANGVAVERQKTASPFPTLNIPQDAKLLWAIEVAVQPGAPFYCQAKNGSQTIKLQGTAKQASDGFFDLAFTCSTIYEVGKDSQQKPTVSMREFKTQLKTKLGKEIIIGGTAEEGKPVQQVAVLKQRETANKLYDPGRANAAARSAATKKEK